MIQVPTVCQPGVYCADMLSKRTAKRKPERRSGAMSGEPGACSAAGLGAADGLAAANAVVCRGGFRALRDPAPPARPRRDAYQEVST